MGQKARGLCSNTTQVQFLLPTAQTRECVRAWSVGAQKLKIRCVCMVQAQAPALLALEIVRHITSPVQRLSQSGRVRSCPSLLVEKFSRAWARPYSFARFSSIVVLIVESIIVSCARTDWRRSVMSVPHVQVTNLVGACNVEESMGSFPTSKLLCQRRL